MAIKKKKTTTGGLQFSDVVAAQSGKSRDELAAIAQSNTVQPTSSKITTQPTDLIKAVPTAANGFGTNVANPYESEYDRLFKQRYQESQLPIDVNKIRKQKIAQFQAEIDATNQIYSNLIAKAQVEGQGRVGQQRAISARSGLINQPRGEAQKEQVLDYNRGIESDIAARQQLAITSIMTEAQNRADEEIAQREQAKRLGAEQYLQYLAGTEERKSKNASAVLQGLLAQGLTLEDIAPEQFTQIANSLRMTPQELTSVYEGELAKAQAAAEQAEYERLKAERAYNLDVEKYNLDVAKENNLNSREGLKLNFDIQKFNKQYELDSKKADAEIKKINFDIANGGANERISDEFAAKYGLPLGLTKSQVAGIIPGQQEKLAAANTEFNELDKVSALINDLKNSPNLDTLIGNTFGLNIPRNIPGTAAYELKNKFNQLKSILSLENASKLKGSGAISDNERKLLADSVTSLNINSNKQAFLNELNKLEQQINTSKQKVQNLQFNAQTNDLFQQFEGGSSGTNPKVSYGGFNDYAAQVGNGRVVTGSKYHTGGEVDIDGKIGDPIPAFRGGKVVEVVDQGNKAYGKKIVIEDTSGNKIIYGHLSSFNVKQGQVVSSGQVIGKMGNSGNVVALKGGDGSHLHIEMRDKSGKVLALRSNNSYA